MPILIVVVGILVLLFLTLKVKLNAFLSFILVSFFTGMALGLNFKEVTQSIQHGIGSTLGFLILILGFGAMLGKLIADSGAAQRITSTLISKFGKQNIQWAVVITGFIVGVPMFYSVAFVMMVPLIFAVAATVRLPLLYVGLPMLSALSVTHGYLPPHPAPTAVATMLDADIGKTLIWGIIVGIPAIIIAGPLFSRTIKNIKAKPLKVFYNPKVLKEEELPSLSTSLVVALLPILLIIIGTIVEQFFLTGSVIDDIVLFLGDPVIAMLLSVLVAIVFLGLKRGRKMKAVMSSLSESVSGITMVILVIAGAGSLKQVLVDSGVGDHIAQLVSNAGYHPLLVAWSMTALLRVCLGSATVAGLTSAGILAPTAISSGVNQELMVLAIGSGSLMLSHVNDSGFWLFKEYFNLNVRETLSTWTVMETIVAVVGIIGIMILDSII